MCARHGSDFNLSQDGLTTKMDTHHKNGHVSTQVEAGDIWGINPNLLHATSMFQIGVEPGRYT